MESSHKRNQSLVLAISDYWSKRRYVALIRKCSSPREQTLKERFPPAVDAYYMLLYTVEISWQKR